MKWFENYCTLSALYSFYKNYHDMHANGDITLKYETNTENLTPKEIKEYLFISCFNFNIIIIFFKIINKS